MTIPGAVQVKWFVRLVLKDMRLGVGQNTILGQIHPDARELYDVNASLKKVCQTLRDPTVRYKLEISSSLKRFANAYLNNASVKLPLFYFRWSHHYCLYVRKFLALFDPPFAPVQ